MRMTTRTALGTLAVFALALLGSGRASAQDADTQAKVEALQQQYEQDLAAQDWPALATLFSEDGVLLPFTGGMFTGREEIQGYHEQSGLTAVDAISTKTETVGGNLILDIGTFTFTATPPGGGGAMNGQGEYVALAEEGANGLQLRSLTSFPVRQAPGAQTQD